VSSYKAEFVRTAFNTFLFEEKQQSLKHGKDK
jgi:hypothetical protein